MKAINKYVEVEMAEMVTTIDVRSTKAQMSISTDETWALFMALADLFAAKKKIHHPLNQLTQ
jgi:hypothetical protein